MEDEDERPPMGIVREELEGVEEAAMAADALRELGVVKLGEVRLLSVPGEVGDIGDMGDMGALPRRSVLT